MICRRAHVLACADAIPDFLSPASDHPLTMEVKRKTRNVISFSSASRIYRPSKIATMAFFLLIAINVLQTIIFASWTRAPPPVPMENNGGGNISESGVIGEERALIPSTLVEVSAAQLHIPAILVSVLWETQYLSKCLRSVDLPVRKIVVVANSLVLPPEEFIEESRKENEAFLAIRELQQIFPPNFLTVVYVGENLGYGRAMNLGMKLVSPWAPWWLCTNADISFPPEALRSVISFVWDDHKNGTLIYLLANGFAVNVLTRAAIKEVGMYDEHIWPAYVEDCDLMLRIRLVTGNVNTNPINGGQPGKYHNLIPSPQFLHAGGQGSGHGGAYNFRDRVHRAHQNNINYYLKKWGITQEHWHQGFGVFGHGCGVPMEGQFLVPFNATHRDNWEQNQYVIAHDAAQATVFGRGANYSDIFVDSVL